MANESRFISWKLIRSHHRVPIFLSTRNNNTHGYNERLILPGHFYDRPRNNSESRNPSLSSIDHRDRASIRKIFLSLYKSFLVLKKFTKNRSNFESNGWYIIDVHIYIDMIHWKGRREKKRGEGKKWENVENGGIGVVWITSVKSGNEAISIGPTSYQPLQPHRDRTTFHDFHRTEPSRENPRRHHSRSFAITQLAGILFFAPGEGGENSVADGLVDHFSTKLLENSDVFKLSILAIHPPPPRFSNRN